jgi:hypothetical protein
MTGMKKIILFTGLVIMAAHFVLLGTYLLKPGPISFTYAYPYFHQDWNLFVPPPSANYRLYAVSEKSGMRTDIFAEILSNHQSNRLKGWGPLLTGLSNSIHYFEKEALENHFYGGPVKNNLNFNIMKKIAESYLNSSGRKNNNDIRLVLCVSEQGLNRIYYN